MAARKIYTLMLVALALLEVCSCGREPLPPALELPPESGGDISDNLAEYTFTAQLPQDCTWAAGEKVAVFDGVGKREFTVEPDSRSIKGYAAKEADVFHAVYPYEASSQSGTQVSVPPVQTVAPGRESDLSALVLSGEADGGKIVFTPAVSYLKVNVPSDVTSVTLKGLAYENVAGNAATVAISPEAAGEYCITFAPTVFKQGYKLVYARGGQICVVIMEGTDISFAPGQTVSVTDRTAEGALAWLANPITTEDELLAYLSNQEAYASEVARLGSDITLTSAWTPVRLTGSLDGDGHTISGLDVKAGADAGMFSVIEEDASLKNITVEGRIVLEASKHPAKAGLAANLYGTMYKVVNKASVEASSSHGACYVGGLAGQILEGSLIDCENAAAVTLAQTSGRGYAGGAAGVIYPAGMVDKCVNRASVTSSSSNMGALGGIVGLQQGGETKVCVNAGTLVVNAGYFSSGIGGIVGVVNNYSVKVTMVNGCRNEGGIELNAPSVQSVGGVVGSLTDGAGDDPSAAEITGCENLAPISVRVGKTAGSGGLDGFYLGGILGSINASNESVLENRIKDCRNLGNLYAALSDDAGANNAVKVGGIAGNSRGTAVFEGNENAAGKVELDNPKSAKLLSSAGGIIGEVGDPWNSEDAALGLVSNINRSNVISRTNVTETPAGGLVGYLFGPVNASGNINLGNVERAASDGSSPDVKSCFAGGFIGMANLSPEHRLPVYFNGDVTVGTIKSVGRAGIFFGGLRSGSRADFKFNNCVVGGRLISPYPGNYDIVLNDDNWDDMNRTADGGYLWGYVSGNYGLSLDGVRYSDASAYD